MTSGQVTVFAILWMVLVGLSLLVLALYRQVNVAYSSRVQFRSGGLRIGVESPEVLVFANGGVSGLSSLMREPKMIVAFARPSCDRCETLMRTFEMTPPEIPVAVLLVEGSAPRMRKRFSASISVFELAHSEDASRDFAVSILPLVYILGNGVVEAVGSAATLRELDDLIAASVGAETGGRVAEEPAHR